MKQMHHRFEHWYKLTHWMSPELERDNDRYVNEVVQAMYIAYRAGYNRAVKDRKEELRGQHG